MCWWTVARRDIISTTPLSPDFGTDWMSTRCWTCHEKSQPPGGEELNGTAQGVLRGHVIDDKGVRRLIQLSSPIAPGLGRNLFSVKQAARNDVVSVADMTNPMLETHNHTFPLQELGHNLYSFSLDLDGSDNGPELVMQAAAKANLCHRRLGHLNRKSLNLLKNLDNNGLSFDGLVPNCNVCAVGKITSTCWKQRYFTRTLTMQTKPYNLCSVTPPFPRKIASKTISKNGTPTV